MIRLFTQNARHPSPHCAPLDRVIRDLSCRVIHPVSSLQTRGRSGKLHPTGPQGDREDGDANNAQAEQNTDTTSRAPIRMEDPPHLPGEYRSIGMSDSRVSIYG